MKNIIDYVKTEFRTFDEFNLNSVDSLVFSQLSYVKIEQVFNILKKSNNEVRIKDLLIAEKFDKMLKNTVEPEKMQELLFNLAASPRYRDIEIINCETNNDKMIEEQFSATTFKIKDKLAYIGFRGTDDTLVGWKEDFNMAYISPTPAQADAVKYAEKIAEDKDIKMYLGGHSKGGNLAVYASMKCNTKCKEKIEKIFSHDGLGFRKEDIESQDFKEIENKICKTIPKSSVIGMLLQNQEKYSIIKSNNHWIMQHAPFSWEVKDDDFIYETKLSNSAKLTDEAISKWIDNLTDEKRKKIADTIFNILYETDSDTFEEIVRNKRKNIPIIISSIRNLDNETKQTIKEIFAMLYEYSIDVLKENIKRKNNY